MTITTTGNATTALVRRGVQGAAAGVGGGIVFGMMMAMMGMLPTIAKLVGGDGALLGMIVHLVISAGIGALYGVFLLTDRLGALLGAGAAYGVIWWILGPLMLMPARLGMPLFAVDQTAMMSLVGHLVYALVTASVLFAIRRRSPSRR